MNDDDILFEITANVEEEDWKMLAQFEINVDDENATDEPKQMEA